MGYPAQRRSEPAPLRSTVNGQKIKYLLVIVWGEKYAMVTGVDGDFRKGLGGIGGMVVVVMVFVEILK